jgi:hypothetical protein
MRWCRLYTETPSDPKLRRIAFQAGTTVANVLAVWTSMLCHASANEGEAWGTLAGWDDMDCAVNLGIDRGVVAATRREMEQRLTLEDRILKWDARQSKNDHSAERMRNWRASKAQEKQEHRNDVTSHPVTVTQSDGKKRREEKIDDTTCHQRASRSTDRGSRLAPEWRPSHADEAFARSLGLDPASVLAEFRDYWLAVPGARGRKTDWSATYRNRCRDRAGRGPAQRGGKLDWLTRDILGDVA